MKKRSKRYRAIAEKVDPNKRYSISEAVKLVKETATAKFKESVDLAIKLNIDTKKSDQLIRGAFSFPHGIGKTVRVIAFVEEPMVESARKAGAIEAGGQDLIKKIMDGWMDFDIAVSHPAMMRHVGKLGRILGPQGKMPSPKTGTVTPDIENAIREFVAGKTEFRNDATGNIHICVGKVDFEDEKLIENIEAFLNHLEEIRPASVKGNFILGVSLSSTMGPSVRIGV